MKKTAALTALLIIGSASLVSAAGLNLGLNDCAPAGGSINAPASCAGSSGITIGMVGSAIAPAGMDRVVGCEDYIDVETNQATLSPWWTLDGCRSNAWPVNFDFTLGPFTCNDFWAGLATGSGSISPEHSAPNRFQMKLVCATVAENPMDTVTEQYLFKVNILRSRSVGIGNCTGCGQAACLVLTRVIINQPDGAVGGNATITAPMIGNFVTYAGGVVAGGCPGATPAQDRTWGQVKSLYR